MPTTNLTLGFLAYSDQKPGNNPMIRNFDLKYSLDGVAANTPLSQNLVVPPMTAVTVFSGVRTVATDGTTQMSTSLPYPSLNTYRFSWTGGTNPQLRTNRVTGASNSTQVVVLLNGSVATYTFGNFAQATDTMDTPNITFTADTIGTMGNSISLVFNGVYATATDTIDSPNITFTATNIGPIGNLISLAFNGLSTVATVVNAWNTANPLNTVAYTGLGTVVPSAQILNLSDGFGGYASAIDTLDTPNIQFTAANVGSIGDSISLVFNGTSTVATVADAWNMANPTNQVYYTGLGTVVPTAQTVNLTGGSSVDSVVSAWNTANPNNQVSYTGLGTVVPVAQTVNLSDGAFLPLTGVVVGDILRVDPTAGFSPINQGEFSIIGIAGSTVSVLNQNAVNEEITLTNTENNSLLMYSNGAAGNQPQIGDSVVVSVGFSPATFGTYQIIDVTPFWFDTNITEPGGIPLETGIMPGAAGMIFYSSAKSSVLVAAQDRCSVRINGDMTDNNLLEPSVVGDPVRPALYLKQGTAWSVVVNNLSENPLNVIIATVE
jgi:hypothetical protein